MSFKVLSFGDEELIYLYEKFIKEIEKLRSKEVNRKPAIESIENILVKMRNDIGFTDNKITKGTLVGLISPTYKDILIAEKIPNDVTLKTFQETDEGIDLNEAKSVDDLFDQLDCE